MRGRFCTEIHAKTLFAEDRTETMSHRAGGGEPVGPAR